MHKASAQMNFGDFWNMLAKTRPELETLELMGHSWLHFHGRDPCYYLLPMLHVKQLAVSLLEIARALVRLPPDVEMEDLPKGKKGKKDSSGKKKSKVSLCYNQLLTASHSPFYKVFVQEGAEGGSTESGPNICGPACGGSKG